MIYWLILSAVLVIIDQVVKAAVVANLVNVGASIPVIDGFFHITYVRNAGMVFGIGGDESGVPLIVFLVIGTLAMIAFGYMIAKNDYKDRRRFFYALALALLLAGALGNLLDRVFQVDHRVVDYLDFRGIWDYVFNFADMCLSVGIAVYLFDQFFLDPKRLREDARKAELAAFTEPIEKGANDDAA
ncbi:MAG: signal peptidase II [Bacillota bacterium]|nr:signal peptidase II [Bacillota bacterium]